jgi:hypothetical protein
VSENELIEIKNTQKLFLIVSMLLFVYPAESSFLIKYKKKFKKFSSSFAAAF